MSQIALLCLTFDRQRMWEEMGKYLVSFFSETRFKIQMGRLFAVAADSVCFGTEHML